MANEKRLIFDVDMKSAFRAWLDNEDFRTINEMIDDVPTADAVEVKHGRWLDVKETELYVPDKKYTVTHTAETCSNCKVRIGFIGGKQYLYDNQCPNCGADMR